MARKFTATKAVRRRVPMLVGAYGASGSGKTYSALRLATGMQRVTGGTIFFVDTESGRALHYADEFDFQHVPMDPPFSPNDYLEAIQFATSKSRDDIVIVDSMSHEHEGPGGVLEMHDAFLDEKCGNDWKKRDKMTFTAWIKPKRQRKRLLQEVIRMGVNGIFCFRAQKKMSLSAGEKPVDLGWQPICGEEFPYEMTVNCLLYPGAKGVPTWDAQTKGEDSKLKLPGQLSHIFKPGQPISEDMGEALARWAMGSDPAHSSATDLDDVIDKMEASESRSELDSIMRDAATGAWSESDKKRLREVVERRRGEFV